MNNMANVFDFSRFVRILTTDLMLLQARRIGFASLALFGVGLLIYVTTTSDAQPEPVDFALGCFMFLLFGGGQVFTSMIFNDMHHPLERFHYLTLPCSNLERFVSRYLITAPLFVVYAVVFFKLFELIANAVCALLWDGQTIPPLDLGSAEFRDIVTGYFMAHVIVFTGAVWFRSYALIKTWATGMVFWTLSAIVMFLAIRIIYADSFISFFEMNPEGPFPDINFDAGFTGEGEPRLWLKLAFTAFLLWILFLAYLGLKEHEVQDGL